MPRLLLVDDDRRHLELVSAILEPDAYTIETATSGESAMRMISAAPPDLVVTDLNLSGINGLQLVRRVKADPRLRRIPMLVLSGHAMPEDEQVARAAGCDGYLVKPAEGKRLRAEIARLLGSS
jgi:CheY-like chemotaxis protein